jgi:uncharacterized protein (DUF58 family)
VGRAIATALLGVALCLSAALFDSPSLYVPGVTLAALALVAVVWVPLAAQGASIARPAGPATVVEDEQYPLRVEVRSGLVPPPGGHLIEPLLDWPVPIGGRRLRRVRINVRFHRRGARSLAPGRLVIRDPLGLCVREVVGEDGGEVLVLPRVEAVNAPGEGGAAGDRSGLGADAHPPGRRLDAASAELEIDGLRAYREGSPASRIHWPSVARHGEMLERRMVAELDSAPLVVLDLSAPAGEDAVDMAVRAAGSLCVHLARSGGCAILLPGERRPVDVGHDLGAWPGVHVRLALATPAPAPGAGRLASRSGAVLWVTAAGLRATPRALERIPASARYLVSPHALPGAAAAFEVAGCTGVRLGPAGRLAA